jgi:small subunit ribosomal protein S20
LIQQAGDEPVAHSISAKKRIRQNEKRRARNRARKEMVKTETKAFLAAVQSGDAAAAEKQLSKVAQRLDRTAAKRAIHPNTAARRRSRLAKKLNALKAGKKPA